jgi:hypothetical protein
MASFVVMSDQGESPQADIRFIRDDFSVISFAAPVVWLLWHRLWLHAAASFAAFGLLAALVAWSANPVCTAISAMSSIAISLVVALEGPQWLKHSLEATGRYHELDVISARSHKQAEEFFAGGMGNAPLKKPAQTFAPATTSSLIPLTGNL